MTIPSVSPILGSQEDSERFVDTDVSLNQRKALVDKVRAIIKANTSMFTDDEGEITDDNSSEEDISLHDLTKSILEELNAEQEDMTRQSDSDVMNEISDDESVGLADDIFEMVTEEDAEHETDDMNLQQQSHSTTECTDTFGPHCRFTRGDEVYSMKKEYKMVKEKNLYALLIYCFRSFSRDVRHLDAQLKVKSKINEWWSGMRKEILVEFADKEIVVGGDGQCDSPGFNAKNLCYFIMEESTNHILDVEVMDKRHVGLVSTNMEKEAVQRCLDRLTKEVNVGQLVTDASTTVKALLGKLIL
ncbi:Hypothetical predicted protein [Paramuricea clavata]|uniref:Uncharacterized protein n=1 Tax=Paramuricea clavata TaxID=317549 RepID=A0A7D9JYA3_PARCT|nr:Hypothetical predicted protein [Paramuricea clavata]